MTETLSTGCLLYGISVYGFVVLALANFMLMMAIPFSQFGQGPGAVWQKMSMLNIAKMPGPFRRIVFFLWIGMISAFALGGLVEFFGQQLGFFVGSTSCPQDWPTPTALAHQNSS